MAHVIEPASSGRAKCRACEKAIAKGELRFGERLPNPYDDAGGEMTLWFHVPCAAYARPDAFLESLASSRDQIQHLNQLEVEARRGLAHRRLPRLRGAERASTGRARCRSCRESIEKDAWRISLQYYDDGRFEPSGFIHVRCTSTYTETTDVVERLRHFSPDPLSEHDLAAIRADLANPPPRGAAAPGDEDPDD